MPCQTETVPVAERAGNQLLRNPYLALKNVKCEYQEGVLTLRGCLPSYYLKQVAQTAVAQLDGVRQIVNLIQVVPPTPREAD
jgi:osmotically-inducible protein OsmY